MAWAVMSVGVVAALIVGRMVRPSRSDRMAGLQWRIKRNESYWEMRIKRQGLRKESS